MSAQNAIFTKILSLRKELNQHSHDYYVLAAPTVSDAEFDALFRELKGLEAAHPQFADPNSPTARVGGAPVSRFEKVAHSVPMLSLENTFSVDEIYHFFQSALGSLGLKDVVAVCEPKIDGASLSITYKNGKMVKAVTRGDGAIGDDVTANVRTIKSVPLEIEFLGDIEVRGEVCFLKSRSAELVKNAEETGEEAFANARNAAAGTLKLKDSREVARRGLTFVAYQIAQGGAEIQSHFAAVEFLGKLGFFTVAGHSKSVSLTLGGLQEAIDHFSKVKDLIEYELDGVVIKLDSIAMQKSLGLKTRSPRWATSYKFPQTGVKTKIKAITCQVGRVGTVTPVAELEPVLIDGSIVKRASLCNQDEIDRLGVDVGDEVLVIKAGAVIPKILVKVS